MSQIFRRAHLRAPIKRDVLFIDDEYVLKARTLNISEGGILLESLPHVPEIKSIPLMIPIPEFPEFYHLSQEQILGLDLDSLEGEVGRFKARLVRSFEGISEVDKIFVTKIGCEFVATGEREDFLVKEYVTRFAKNLIFLLGLFEGRGFSKKTPQLIRKCSDLLGYDSELPVAQLRLKALHDYQSLESL
tara:strand:+ start:36363 stop:36929 length:567 start_codon:yes stop_codon:yes gene_type:complete